MDKFTNCILIGGAWCKIRFRLELSYDNDPNFNFQRKVMSIEFASTFERGWGQLCFGNIRVELIQRCLMQHNVQLPSQTARRWRCDRWPASIDWFMNKLFYKRWSTVSGKTLASWWTQKLKGKLEPRSLISIVFLRIEMNSATLASAFSIVCCSFCRWYTKYTYKCFILHSKRISWFNQNNGIV